VFQTDKALCDFLWGTLLSHMSRGKILNIQAANSAAEDELALALGRAKPTR
jgi:hypothetical protein